MTDFPLDFSDTIYPPMIQDLPEIEIPRQDVRGWLLQNGAIQAVFFDLEAGGTMPHHDHCCQWGIVLEGKMELTIAAEAKVYKKGDRYFIPEGVTHSAKFLTRVFVLDCFASSNRYKEK